MSEKVCAESGREALAVRLERIEATIKERIEDGTFVPAMTPADPGKSIGDALVRAVRSGAHQVEFHAGAYDLGYGYKEGCLTAIRPALDEVGEHCVEYYDFDSGEWHGHRTNMGMTVPRFRFPDVQDEVEAAAPAPGAAPADLVGEQVLRALRAGATHVTVDKQDPCMYLLAPPPDMSDASIMAERPGQVFDFAKGTWVDRTPEGYDTNGGSVAGVGIRYLEAPGEAAVNASAPSGLRVKA